MTDNTKIMDKIKKCLALSASSNEHEAAAALRQAQKMMEAHDISDVDVKAAQAEERKAKAGAKSNPANWEAMLASRVGASFRCRVVFQPGWRTGEWLFIGCGSTTEVAAYAFAVLHRQARHARKAHIETGLKRCKSTTKTRRADLFCEGWVHAVARLIQAFAISEEDTSAIEAYMLTRYPSQKPLAATDRNKGRNLSSRELDDFHSGHMTGRDARLNRGVDGATAQLAIGGGA